MTANKAGQAMGAPKAAAVMRRRHMANHTVAVLPMVDPAVKTTVHNMVAMGAVLRTTIRYVAVFI